MNVVVDVCEANSKNRGDGPRSLQKSLRRFGKKEDGAMVVFTLFIFIFMLIMAGLGIDTMRHEMHRAQLQATLDSAVLAAAKQPSDEEAIEVIEDYFVKSGRSDYLNDINPEDINITQNEATVAATATISIDTYLMKLAGVPVLATNASSAASTASP
ncbi:MAG: pilus assembly protein TadG-related protein, partial [Pseudomonadota bacterium]